MGVSVWVLRCVHMCVHVCVCNYVCMNVCACMCMRVLHVHVYACVCLYLYLYFLGQINPCPKDRAVFSVFTCARSESFPAAVRWLANDVALYTFDIPNDIGGPRANQSAGGPGLIATLVNETMFTLMADLTTTVDIINGTSINIVCGELVTNIKSQPLNLFVIGKKKKKVWKYYNFSIKLFLLCSS